MSSHAEFTVLDAFAAPHGGRILRLRLKDGDPPRVRKLKGAELLARGPGGEERRIRVTGFPLFGGRPSDERLARTGRIDVAVENESEDGDESGADVSMKWTVVAPL